jgi:D-ribose pyranose/furanose isomerase RbsD
MSKINELLENFEEKRQQFLEDLQREYDVLKKNIIIKYIRRELFLQKKQRRKIKNGRILF